MNSEASNSSGSAPKVPEKIITFKEKIGYASGDMASVLFFKVFASFLVFFYTDMLSIPAATIGFMLIITRIFDAANDPIMGVICDRTNSPHGKFRPWLRWMVIPYALSGILVFTVPDWGDSAKIVYVYITYTLAMVFYTSINIPYGALMGVMTPHSSERTVLSSFRFYGAYLANMIVQGTILYLVIYLGGSEDGKTATQAGYVNTMILYAVCAGALFLFTFSSTKERIQPPKGQEMNLKKDFAQLLKNKPWVSIVVIGVTTIIWIALRDAAILYYFKYYVVGVIGDDEKWSTMAIIFNVVGTVGTLIGVACTKWFTDLFKGKKNAYFWLTVIVAFAGCTYFLAGQGDVTLVITIQFFTSFLMGPLMPLFWSMIADTADYSEWKFGRRFTGLTFSAGTFSQKVGWAIGPALGAFLLDYYGYVDNVEQSARTIEGLRLMMSFIPSGIAIVASFVVLTYGINLAMEKQMERELAERKTAEGTIQA